MGATAGGASTPRTLPSSDTPAFRNTGQQNVIHQSQKEKFDKLMRGKGGRDEKPQSSQKKPTSKDRQTSPHSGEQTHSSLKPGYGQNAPGRRSQTQQEQPAVKPESGKDAWQPGATKTSRGVPQGPQAQAATAKMHKQ